MCRIHWNVGLESSISQSGVHEAEPVVSVIIHLVAVMKITSSYDQSHYIHWFFFFLDLLACLTGLLNWMDLIQTSVTLKQVADKWSRIGGMFMNKKNPKNFMALINSRNFIASHLNNEANTWKSKSVKFVLQLMGFCLLKSLLVEGLYKSVTIPSFFFFWKVWPWECIETGSRSVHSSLQESMVCFWNELFPIPRFLAQLPWGSFSALRPMLSEHKGRGPERTWAVVRPGRGFAHERGACRARAFSPNSIGVCVNHQPSNSGPWLGCNLGANLVSEAVHAQGCCVCVC